MALSGSTVFEVRPAGSGSSDTNGGAFVTGASGTDHSQQDSPQYAVTDGVTAGTTAITSATANFGTDVIGNIVYVQGGTGSITAGWYQITARPSTTEITVDRSTGLTAGTGVTLNIGGALASPGLAAALATVSGMRIWWKAGTYNISTSTPGAGGPVVTTTSINISIDGYDATRGDATGTRPVLVWTASSPGATTYCVTLTGGAAGALQVARNIAVDGNSVANVSGFRSQWRSSYFIDCHAMDCDQASQSGLHAQNMVACSAVACTTGLLVNDGQAIAERCSAVSCVVGINVNGGLASQCVAHNCTNNGFSSPAYGRFLYCTADGTTSGPGFQGAAAQAVGCVATNNSTYGFDTTAGYLVDCASYLNTTARSSGTILQDINPILLGADPYVNRAADDFRPNTDATGGALLRSTGLFIPGQTNHADLGAVQSEPSATGGGGIVSGNFRGNFQ